METYLKRMRNINDEIKVTASGYLREQHKSIFDDKYGLFQSIPDIVCILTTLYYNPRVLKFKKGDLVLIQQGKSGIVRFIGPTSFSEGNIIGIEMYLWSPNATDGTVNNEKIFIASKGQAKFVYPEAIESVEGSRITEGSYARVKGLVRDSKFNGKTVKIIAYVEKRSKWKVKLLHARQEKKYLGIKTENLDPILDWGPLNNYEEEIVLADCPRIGDRVKCMDGRYGIVKYVGDVDFDKKFGTWIGLELEEWDPNGNNGTIRDKTYFTVNDGFGYFVKLKIDS